MRLIPIRVIRRMADIVLGSLVLALLWSCDSRDATEVDEDTEAAGLWRDLAAAKTSEGMQALVAQEIVRFALDEQLLLERRTAFANAVLRARADTADGQ